MNSQATLLGGLTTILLILCLASSAAAQQTGQIPLGQLPGANTRPATSNGQQLAVQQPARVNPMEPEWYRSLTPAQHQHIDDILKYWEFKSSSVKRYRCEFRRWDYDPVFGPQNQAKEYSTGDIKYSAPDKGLYRVTSLQRFAEGKYEPVTDESQFEQWICDGQWVYYFDHAQKKLVQSQLPPEIRGKAIGKGPLPFLFNANAEDIKRRFWVRVVTPPQVAEQEYHLEAVPRLQEEAANYRVVKLILARQDFLPKAMVVFDRNGRSHTTFEFNNREVNFSVLAETLNLFHREFFEPAAPSGWTKQVVPYQGLATPGNTAAAPGGSPGVRR